MRHQQAVKLLLDEFWRLASKHDLSTTQVRF
jgi:hypothetical protein